MGVNLQLLPPTSAPQQADALGQAAGAQDGRLLASASNLSALVRCGR